MGWKNVRDHYKIMHNIFVENNIIHIGSGFIPSIIAIDNEGEILKKYTGNNADLMRYQLDMAGNTAKLRNLIQTPDQFEHSLSVYTYEGANIIEKSCEKYGWPNTTHDGEPMYDNTFSPDKSVVIQWAMENAQSRISVQTSILEDKQKDVARIQADIESVKSHLEVLKELSRQHPIPGGENLTEVVDIKKIYSEEMPVEVYMPPVTQISMK